MSDVICIGIGRREPGRPTRIADHEAFQARLLGIPEHDTADSLHEQLLAAAEGFIDAKNSVRGDTQDLLLATAQLGAISMAQVQLEVHQGRRTPQQSRPLSWVRIARAALKAQASDESFGIGKISPNLNAADVRNLLDLTRMTLATLTPWGSYGRYAFAAGIAAQEIRVVLPFEDS